MNLGNLVTLHSPISAYSETGEVFSLDPGCTGLVLGYDDYDITLLMYGSILYTQSANESALSVG